MTLGFDEKTFDSLKSLVRKWPVRNWQSLWQPQPHLLTKSCEKKSGEFFWFDKKYFWQLSFDYDVKKDNMKVLDFFFFLQSLWIDI